MLRNVTIKVEGKTIDSARARGVCINSVCARAIAEAAGFEKIKRTDGLIWSPKRMMYVKAP